MKKLGRSKSDHTTTQSHDSHGLVGLLETMRVQMEVLYDSPAFYFYEPCQLKIFKFPTSEGLI